MSADSRQLLVELYDAAVAAAVWAGKAAGIATWGSTSVVVIDAAGASRTVRFSRPTNRAAALDRPPLVPWS